MKVSIDAAKAPIDVRNPSMSVVSKRGHCGSGTNQITSLASSQAARMASDGGSQNDDRANSCSRYLVNQIIRASGRSSAPASTAGKALLAPSTF